MGLQLELPRFGFRQGFNKGRTVHAGKDRVGSVPDFSLHCAELPGDRSAIGLERLRRINKRPRILLPEPRESIGPEQRAFHAAQNCLLRLVLQEACHAGALARSLLFGGFAVVAFVYCTSDRQRPTAFGAAEEARQKKLGAGADTTAVGAPPGFDLEAVLARFDPRPEVIVDDPQLRNLHANPFFLRPQAGDALLCLRVSTVLEAIPDPDADIEFVVQDAGAALAVAEDSVLAPGSSARAWDSVLVQLVNDFLGRYPLCKLRQDTTNDLRLTLIDDQRAFDLVASFVSRGHIAVRAAAGAFPRGHIAREAAMGL
nr:hypothetical protein [Sulfitobacter sp. D7]